MIKAASKEKFEPGPVRPAQPLRHPKTQPAASSKASSKGFEAFAKELGGAREKKAASTADLLTRIVREKHVVLDLARGASLQKFSRKTFSPAIRNGLASRAFGRNKLDEFVAATEEKTHSDLHDRIKLCVNQKITPAAASRSKAALLKKKAGDRKAHSEFTLLNQSSSPHPHHSPNHASLKSLLDGKLDEPLLLQEDSKLSKHPAKTRSNSKAVIQLLHSPVQQQAVFPKTYKILAKEDRQIVSRFDPKTQLSEGNRFSLFLQAKKEDQPAFK